MTGSVDASGAVSPSFDVVVVGGGNAGLISAITAAEQGARVVILQKLPDPGGKSSLAIGSISAAGTSLQRARGIVDDDEAHWADLTARIRRGGIQPLSMLKLELAVRGGAAVIERLLGLGVSFTGPHPELPDEQWRMHVISPDARALVTALADRAAALDVTFVGDWPVDRLERLDDSVIGVAGERGVVRCNGHVVLASGDFSAPGRLQSVRPDGSEYAFRPWSSGDGQLMAAAAGGRTTHMDVPLRLQLRTTEWPHIEPTPAFLRTGAILVDASGKRFVNELDQPAAAIADAGDPDVFVICDASTLGRIPSAADDSPYARDAWLRPEKTYISTFPGIGYAYAEDLVEAGYGHVVKTPETLARALGIDAVGLRSTLEGYELNRRAGRPDPFGRIDRASGLGLPPWFGFGPLRAVAILGRAGIEIDEETHVLDDSGEPVPGLLAAGAAAGVTGFAYGHGYELAWALVSGRLAGRSAVTAPRALGNRAK